MVKIGLLIMWLLLVFAGCDSSDKAIVQKETNESQQKILNIEIPVILSDPLKELDLSMYKKDGYYMLGSHVWMDEKVPHGIILLAKDGEYFHTSTGFLYAIEFAYEPDLNNQWKIKTETRITELGNYGKAAESVIFLKLGIKQFAFALIKDDMNFGIGKMRFSLFGRINGKYECIMEQLTDFENGSAVEKNSPEYFSESSEIFIIENRDKEFFDLRVKTKLQKGNKILPEEVKILTFKNGKYEIIPPSR